MSVYLGSGEDSLKAFEAGQAQEVQKDKITEKLAEVTSEQVVSKQDAQDETNPLVAAFRNFDKKIQAHTATKMKAKEAKQAKKKLLPVKEIEAGAQQFKNNNPQFRLDSKKLVSLAERLQDGASKEDILKVIHEEFPDPLQASLAWKFVVSIVLYETDTLDLESIDHALNEKVVESIDKREEEVAKKAEAEAAAVHQEATATALKIVQGGDLNKLLEHLMSNPIEAPAIFKMLDDAYGGDLRKIESYLLKKCGLEVNKLIKLESEGDIPHMKNAMALIKKLQAIIWVDRFFESRNKPEQAAAQAAGSMRRK